jgi:predicted metal-dependent phosphoesterase TrpH
MQKWKVELHCHTAASGDSLVKVRDLIRVAKKRGLDRLAITDHNTIKGALAAKAIDPELIIVGEEILTTKGELLAFFVQEEIPRGLTPTEALKRLREQNAFISVSHPFDQYRHGWALSDLQEITPYIDAVEIFNARSFTPSINQAAKDFARENKLLGTVGSDAHLLIEVGKATQLVPIFSDAETLRISFTNSETIENYSSPFIRFGSTYAKIVKSVFGNDKFSL